MQFARIDSRFQNQRALNLSKARDAEIASWEAYLAGDRATAEILQIDAEGFYAFAHEALTRRLSGEVAPRYTNSPV